MICTQFNTNIVDILSYHLFNSIKCDHNYNFKRKYILIVMVNSYVDTDIDNGNSIVSNNFNFNTYPPQCW